MANFGKKVLAIGIVVLWGAAHASSLSLSIDQPPSGMISFVGDTLVFRATLSGTPPVPLDSIIWESELDGTLGRGLEVRTALLSVNVHRVSVVAWSDGLVEGSDSVAAEVRPFDGVDVYCGGESPNEGQYWVNDARYSAPGMRNGVRNVVCDEDGNVYAVGSIIGSVGSMEPFYVKNGVPVALQSDHPAWASAIAVEGSTVYVGGFDYDTVSRNGFPSRPCVWVDGEKAYAGTLGISTALCVVDGNTLLAGRDDSNRACYWDRNVKTVISDGFSEANWIFSCDGAVYVAGHDHVVIEDMVVIVSWYWRNGVKKFFTQDSTADSLADPFAGLQISSFFVDERGNMYAVGDAPSWPPREYFWMNGKSTEWTYPLSTPAAVTALHGHVFIAGIYNPGTTVDSLTFCYWRNGVLHPLPSATGRSRSMHSIYVVDRPPEANVPESAPRSERRLPKRSGAVRFCRIGANRFAGANLPGPGTQGVLLTATGRVITRLENVKLSEIPRALDTYQGMYFLRLE